MSKQRRRARRLGDRPPRPRTRRGREREPDRRPAGDGRAFRAGTPTTWSGRLERLPESEAREIPPHLASRYGGPVAVKAGGRPDALVPQTQQYLVYIDMLEPDAGIASGSLAKAKIHCKPETCVRWLWRTINNTFDLGLM